MFPVCCSSTLKRAQYPGRILVILYGNATQTQCFLWPDTVFSVTVALHCPHLFHPQTQAWSKFSFLHPKPISLLFSLLFLFFCFLLNPSQALCPPSTSPHSSVYPPQTALASSGGLYCLHGCAVNIWSALRRTAAWALLCEHSTLFSTKL